jgi:hypothetical protein
MLTSVFNAKNQMSMKIWRQPHNKAIGEILFSVFNAKNQMSIEI